MIIENCVAPENLSVELDIHPFLIIGVIELIQSKTSSNELLTEGNDSFDAYKPNISTAIVISHA